MSRASNEVFVSLQGRGWPVVCDCIAVIRLRDHCGFAVGVQDRFRAGGVGRVWPSLHKARRRAEFLAQLNHLPVVESI